MSLELAAKSPWSIERVDIGGQPVTDGTVELVSGLSLDSVHLALIDTRAEISGTVTTQRRQPAGGRPRCRVSGTRDPARRRVASAVTDAAGRYRLASVPLGPVPRGSGRGADSGHPQPRQRSPAGPGCRGHRRPGSEESGRFPAVNAGGPAPAIELPFVAVPVIVPRADHRISRRDIDPDALKVLYRLHEHDIRGLSGRRQRPRPAARPAAEGLRHRHRARIRSRSRSCSGTAGSSGGDSASRTSSSGSKTIEVATFRESCRRPRRTSPTRKCRRSWRRSGRTASRSTSRPARRSRPSWRTGPRRNRSSKPPRRRSSSTTDRAAAANRLAGVASRDASRGARANATTITTTTPSARRRRTPSAATSPSTGCSTTSPTTR